MREILFRGKTDKGEWVEGFYCGKVNKTIFSPAEDSAQIIDKNLYWHEVIPETVGQYTGLTDKNDKKIFEGDIIKGSWETILTIFFDEISSSYRVKTSTGHEREPSYYGIEKFEVIGNIHDNPELLAGGDCNG